MKSYLLDTNIFISNPYCLDEFSENGNNMVFVYIGVLNELDDLKSNPHKGFYARKAIHNIYQKVIDWKAIIQYNEEYDYLPVDDALIALAKDNNYILVTQDKTMHIKAFRENIQIEDYESVKVKELPNFREQEFKDYEPIKKVFGVTPKDENQQIAMNVLLDKDIPLVALTGRAGTGKNLLTLACAFEQIIEEPFSYNTLYISRMPIPNTVDVGYLPGNLEEKLNPWLNGINDNISFLLNRKNDSVSAFLDQYIKILSISHIKGASITDGFIIIDEAQDIHPNDIKMLISRVGEGTKIVLLGDIEQINANYLSEQFNGLSHVITNFFGHKLFRYVHLETVYRSELATAATELL